MNVESLTYYRSFLFFPHSIKIYGVASKPMTARVPENKVLSSLQYMSTCTLSDIKFVSFSYIYPLRLLRIERRWSCNGTDHIRARP